MVQALRLALGIPNPAQEAQLVRRHGPATTATALAIGVLLLCAAVTYAQWPLAHTGAFPHPDSGAYGWGGHVVLRGGTLYVDYVENKPPLVFLINAAALWLSGGRLAALWVASWLALSAAVLLAYAAVRQWYGMGPAALTALSLAATLHPLLEGGNLTETYALPLQAAALWLATRACRRGRETAIAGALGVLAGLCFLLRPNLVGASVAVLLMMGLAQPHHLPRIMGASAGAAVLVLVTALGYLQVRGALGDFVEQVLQYNLAYSETTFRSRVRETITAAADGAGPLAPFVWIGFPAAALATIRDRRRAGFFVSSPALLITLWIPIELAAVSISGRHFLHYYAPVALALSLALAHGLYLGRELVVASPRLGAVFTPRGLALSLSLLVATEVIVQARRDLETLDYPDYNSYWRNENAAVAAVRRHSDPGEPVLIWGFAPGVYLRAGRDPVSAFAHPYQLLERNWVTPAMVNGFFRDLRQARPPVIVDAFSETPTGLLAVLESTVEPGPFERYWPSPELKPLAEWVRINYDPAGEIGPGRWKVYLLKSGSD